MQVGIVGLPQSGKTTLLNAITGQALETGGFTGRESVNFGTSKVPDERLEALYPIFEPERRVPATVDFLDVAGFSKSKDGEKGISSELLGKMRNVDMLMAVLRCFQNDMVAHPDVTIDAKRDMETLKAEFFIADQDIVENRIDKIERSLKNKKDADSLLHLDLMKKCLDALEAEKPLRSVDFNPVEEKLLRGYNFLTLKPLLIVLNLGDKDIGSEEELLADWASATDAPNTRLAAVSAGIESEIQELEDEEAEMFREELGMKESALYTVIRGSYDLLGYISFFTVGKDEVRAWSIANGTLAPSAAGTIHGDIERGFIRAEVVSYDDFMVAGSLAECKKNGSLRLEGKDYLVLDGDIINYRFSV